MSREYLIANLGTPLDKELYGYLRIDRVRASDIEKLPSDYSKLVPIIVKKLSQNSIDGNNLDSIRLIGLSRANLREIEVNVHEYLKFYNRDLWKIDLTKVKLFLQDSSKAEMAEVLRVIRKYFIYENNFYHFENQGNMINPIFYYGEKGKGKIVSQLSFLGTKEEDVAKFILNHDDGHLYKFNNFSRIQIKRIIQAIESNLINHKSVQDSIVKKMVLYM